MSRNRVASPKRQNPLVKLQLKGSSDLQPPPKPALWKYPQLVKCDQQKRRTQEKNQGSLSVLKSYESVTMDHIA